MLRRHYKPRKTGKTKSGPAQPTKPPKEEPDEMDEDEDEDDDENEDKSSSDDTTEASLDEVTKSLAALRFVPPSVRFGARARPTFKRKS
jgi:hypothetical protein